MEERAEEEESDVVIGAKSNLLKLVELGEWQRERGRREEEGGRRWWTLGKEEELRIVMDVLQRDGGCVATAGSSRARAERPTPTWLVNKKNTKKKSPNFSIFSELKLSWATEDRPGDPI